MSTQSLVLAKRLGHKLCKFSPTLGGTVPTRNISCRNLALKWATGAGSFEEACPPTLLGCSLRIRLALGKT